MTSQPRHRERRVSVQIGALELVKKGGPRRDLRDPYQLALTISWRSFFVALALIYLALNAGFAGLYLLEPGSIARAGRGSFLDAFFFSVETMDTVGYGEMAPGTLYGHAISVCEALFGLVFTAVVTGLVFVRFSRPKANILFAGEAVVGGPAERRVLSIRLANARPSLLVDARARLYGVRMTRAVVSDGRRVFELKLENPHLPVFALDWTLRHVIEADGPLESLSGGAPAASDLMLLTVVMATDVVTSITVNAAREYAAPHIHAGMRYAQSISQAGDHEVHFDLGRIGAIEPEEPGS